MELATTRIDLASRNPTVILNAADAEDLGAHPYDRVQVRVDGTTTIGIVEVTDGLVPAGTMGVTDRVGHIDGTVDVTLAPRPDAVHYVRKKLKGVELEADEVDRIVRDVHRDRLSDIELAAYVTAAETQGLSFEETKHLTTSMAAVGDALTWEIPIVADKHSIGGVAGNRVTPIVVPIVAAAGVTIPKTSSRAVTSPAGTADTMAVFCDVEFDVNGIERIVNATNGCLVWGGGVNLSPVDDKIIRAEHPLAIDPHGQLIASVLSKKQSAGATHVVVDVPYGEGAKVESLPAARELAEDFKRVGSHLDLHVECTITRGTQPIGTGIGPVLEARDVLRVLQGDGPRDLRRKSVRLADILLECCGVDADAATILDEGRALERFRDIVAAQNGDPDVAVADLVPGSHTIEHTAAHGGVVTTTDNRQVSDIARRAGAPRDHGAGIVLHASEGDAVAAGDPLLTVHAERASKLEEARSRLDRTEPLRVRDPDESLVERV